MASDICSNSLQVRDSPDAIEYHPTNGQISVKDLTFAYNENRVVLDKISFDVASGQSIALVGRFGLVLVSEWR